MSNLESLAYDYSSPQESEETRRKETTHPEGAEDPEQEKNPEKKEFHSTDGREMVAVRKEENDRIVQGMLAGGDLDAEFSALYPSDESPETTAQRNTEVSPERTA